jgi:hypothetical protein
MLSRKGNWQDAEAKGAVVSRSYTRMYEQMIADLFCELFCGNQCINLRICENP